MIQSLRKGASRMGEGKNMGRIVSVFQSARQTVRKPKWESGHSIIKGIIGGAYRKEVEPIREKSKGGDSKGANELKNKLPVIAWAGQFADRKKLIKHSGLLCIDIDGIGAGTQDAIGKLRKHPSVYAAFVSPRGNGVKAVFRVPPDKDIHACVWRAAAQEAEKQTGFKADEATKNINSLCFVSYDPEAYFNPDAEELAVSKSNKEDKETRSNSPEELSQRKMIALRLLGEIKWESNA
ncbi:MAG: BT4734/BF3469 family protein, partial [Planctomycetota bacterium]|nr:BT4734/BF3469 family protein [Planctomycetota bacterium]